MVLSLARDGHEPERFSVGENMKDGLEGYAGFSPTPIFSRVSIVRSLSIEGREVRGSNGYRCVATSTRAWVQQVAVSYIQRGYHQYVGFWIPKGKDPTAVDRKLIAKYHIDISDSARSWRKRSGLARFQYIRHGRFGLLMIADSGEEEGPPSVVMPRERLMEVLAHYGADLYRSRWRELPDDQVMIDFEQEEGVRMKHLYRDAIFYGGYEIRYRNSHASVRIDARYYEALRTRMLDLARQPDLKPLREAFHELRFQPFAPLKTQLWNLVDELNKYRAKRQVGGRRVPYSVVARCLRRQTGPLVVPTGRITNQGCDGKERTWIEQEKKAA